MRGIRTGLTAVISVGLLAGSAVGVAAQETDPMAPSFFSRTVPELWEPVARGTEEQRPDGVVDGVGWGFSFPFEADDPRISGTLTFIGNETDYRDGATTLAPTGRDGAVRSNLTRIVNDAGSWEGVMTGLQVDSAGIDDAAGWLTGTDAYEGLTAFVLWDFPDAIVVGHITAEGPPPTPEMPTADQ